MHAVSSNFPKAMSVQQSWRRRYKTPGITKAAKNASELNAIFDEIQKSETTTSAYTKVTMEDTLSGYVELADSNYKVVAKDASGKVVSLTKNVDYTLTYDENAKKFTVSVPEGSGPQRDVHAGIQREAHAEMHTTTTPLI